MAGIDLSQFHEVFFEESFEGVEVLESGLLNLDLAKPDPGAINTMFRAAHSIKGGAGTFGFGEIADFTHVLESILDDARDDASTVTDEFVQRLLEAIDFLKHLLMEAKSGNGVPEDETAAFIARLESSHLDTATGSPGCDTSTSFTDDMTGAATSHWRITIAPARNMFEAGHDPFRLIRELATLGHVTEVQLDAQDLPEIEHLDPERCFLSWVIGLETDQPRDRIDSVFEWIDDEACITIAGQEEQDSSSGPRPEPVPKQDVPVRAAASTTHLPEMSSIRVNIDRVDSLVNLVGELVITQSMLSRFKEGIDEADIADLVLGIEQLEENTREIQDQTMRIRMLPVDSVFQRLPRLVRDVSRSLGKEVELVLTGNQTEVDKTVLEKIADPLTHLVRNSLDHGIESSEQRQIAGKPPKGRVHVRAYHEGSSIVIEVQDDGAGLDRDRILAKAIEKGIVQPEEEPGAAVIDSFIFSPGFSTAQSVSEVSGRGVGMDVVKNNIEQLNGHIGVTSVSGEGTTFTIRLPLTLSIIEGQLVRVGSDLFVIPLLSILESNRINETLYGRIAGGAETWRFHGEYIRLLRLDRIYGIKSDYRDARDAIVVVVSAQQQFGILVDEVLGQQQVVVKSLETNFKLVPTVSGATILGDGSVAMILDIASLFNEMHRDTR